MTDTKNMLWEAERLALFSNAGASGTFNEREEDMARFRAKHEGFFPERFWTDRETGTLGPADAPSDWPVPYWWPFQQVLRLTWEEGFPLESSVLLITGAERGHAYPYQYAVMFLAIEPWRARFCPRCGKRFVADKPARRFCSTACTGNARQGTRAASWKRHGKKWRTRYEKKKASRKPRRKAKR